MVVVVHGTRTKSCSGTRNARNIRSLFLLYYVFVYYYYHFLLFFGQVRSENRFIHSTSRQDENFEGAQSFLERINGKGKVQGCCFHFV